jgi:chromosome segregation ATPase
MHVQLLKHDLNALDGEKNQLTMDIEERKKIEEDKIRPIIEKLNTDNETLKIDIKQSGEKNQKEKDDENNIDSEIKQLDDNINKINEENGELKKEARARETEPDRHRKHAEVMHKAIDGLQKEINV